MAEISPTAPSTDHVFRTVDSGNRKEIEDLVMNPNVSLGLVDPVDGITLVYDLLTKSPTETNSFSRSWTPV